jgi:hypothetical protein
MCHQFKLETTKSGVTKQVSLKKKTQIECRNGIRNPCDEIIKEQLLHFNLDLNKRRYNSNTLTKRIC